MSEDSFDTGRIPIPGPTVAARVIDGQALLLDPAATELRRMNPVGSFVWSRIMERDQTIAQIHLGITETFEVDSDLAYEDLVVFLQKLHSEGLITYKTD